MNYIAHIREADRQHQTVEEHLLGVQALAESFGKKLGVSHIAGLAGMLHDMGKYTDAFRKYILAAVNNPDFPPKRGSVDHSTAGGKFLYNLFHAGEIHPIKGLLAEIVGNAIIFLPRRLSRSRIRVELFEACTYIRDNSLEEFERTHIY